MPNVHSKNTPTALFLCEIQPPDCLGSAGRHSQAPFDQSCTGRNWTDQQLEEPETRLVVAGFDGVDEEEHHEAVEDQRVDLHGDVGVLRVQAGEDAETPQHTQEPCDLQPAEGGGHENKNLPGEKPGSRNSGVF